MAMTPAERKRRQRAKEREQIEKDRHKGGDAAADCFHTPFSEWEKRHSKVLDLIEYTSLAGFELPLIEDERDPEEFVIDRDLHGEGVLFGDAKGALGRAEITVSVLIDTAIELASAVNQYKREEIEARLAELENSDTADRATAMKEAVKLNKMLDQLNKQVRRAFPQWRVTGV